MWLSCCKCISVFGILFYVAMGFIIMGQAQFLKFVPEDKDSSVGACFVTAVLYLLIIVVIIVYEKWQRKGSVSRQHYYDLGSQRDIRPRQSGFRSTGNSDLNMIREQNNSQMMREQ